ncbi:MAG TPA: tRNA guanosine(34) transglycosylase Tgt [Bacteroidales bacterium]|nr:tRNA guanosine(34) transglycosylase Tgt [Bacteroidales bacterium]HPS73844.1 tRNA guanosine(34) transglycosylase Tgt [Bacteroidales bacterium]
MEFSLSYRDSHSSARAGTLTTDHGLIETPFFMPVGTAGAVKALHIRQLHDEVKAQIMLSNTYHLFLRPGVQTVAAAGGIHRFNGWDRPVLTDSGGYQIYSLAAIRKITENGVVFQSHTDGSRHTFTPETVMDIQRSLGADIIMAFDECTPYPCDLPYAKKSMKRTHRWLDRCVEQYRSTECPHGYTQALFPIVQGSVYPDLRKESAEYIASRGCAGNAIGGLSVGEPAEEMYAMTDLVCRILPDDKPRYLMGVGTPANILESIALGIDMFDCVIPTRNGRNGWLFTRNGIINIKNEKWKDDFSPIEEDGEVPADHDYSKAFLRHLFVAREMLAPMITTVHNLGFYMWLMRESRKKIIEGTFSSWKNVMTKQLMQRI